MDDELVYEIDYDAFDAELDQELDLELDDDLDTADSESSPELGFWDRLWEEYGSKEPEECDVSENTGEAPVWRRILKDVFHLIDLIPVSRKHGSHYLYYQAIRDAIFVDDVYNFDKVSKVLWQRRGVTIEEFRQSNHGKRYLSARVRRHIPEPRVLLERTKCVFEFFADQRDATTNAKFFSKDARKQVLAVLQMIEEEYVSDPPGTQLYTIHRIDSDGLEVYKCRRSTSGTEGLHTLFSRKFGPYCRSGKQVDYLLTTTTTERNMQQAITRKGEPDYGHRDYAMEDRIAAKFESLTGRPYTVKVNPWNSNAKGTWVQWQKAGDFVATGEQIGISSLTHYYTKDQLTRMAANVPDEVTNSGSDHQYVAQRQGLPAAMRPIYTNIEWALFEKLLKTVGGSASKSRSDSQVKTLMDLRCREVNGQEVLCKIPSHFAQAQTILNKNMNCLKTSNAGYKELIAKLKSK